MRAMIDLAHATTQRHAERDLSNDIAKGYGAGSFRRHLALPFRFARARTLHSALVAVLSSKAVYPTPEREQ